MSREAETEMEQVALDHDRYMPLSRVLQLLQGEPQDQETMFIMFRSIMNREPTEEEDIALWERLGVAAMDSEAYEKAAGKSK